jgi:hypothetical protein
MASVKNPRPANIAAGAVTLCGFLLFFLLMLSLGLRRGMIHDESQHLAAGALFGRHLLLPYRDFPYFHMPDLVFVYGAIFHFYGSMLFAARLLNVEAGWLTCVLIWYIVWRECRGISSLCRWLLPAAAALLLVSNPIFRETYWRAWNHATATLFALGSFALAMRPSASGSPNGSRWFWSGLLLGLAIGTRLTFAPFFAPLAVACLFPVGPRIRSLLLFCAGNALALLPSLILFLVAPLQFYFGNFTFNSTVNILFRQFYHDSRISFHAKLLFLGALLRADIATFLLLLACVLFVVAAFIRFSKMPADLRYRLLLLLGLIPFGLFGALAASPSQPEYYYALIPILVLATALAAAFLCSGHFGWLSPLLLLIPAIYCTSRSWNEYQRIAILRDSSTWPPLLMHEAGAEAAMWIGKGQVMTLDPVFPLEGGLDIYPSLVTGIIEWRTEPFIAAADRDRLKILGPDNFVSTLDRSPPAALLTIDTTGFDAPLVAWAKSHRYAPRSLEPRGKLVDQPTIWTPSPYPQQH